MAEPASPLDTPERREFALLLEENFAEREFEEGSLVKGSVVAIENGMVVIDVGLKTEGRVPIREFQASGEEEKTQIEVGSEVEVYLERIENAVGEAVISREKARREGTWKRLEAAFKAKDEIEGSIVGRVKGGFTVELGGVHGFLPGSQVDVRPVRDRDVTPLYNLAQPMQILKMDRRKGNIVVSRRAILEETRNAQRAELLKSLEEGSVVEGVVRNITDYGAFVDLGGVDGLLHVTDLAWRRVSHPSEVLQDDQKIKVQVLRVNRESQRISLGLKQLETDPWETIRERYLNGSRIVGKVMNITDYGAFVELEPGIEGLVHISEMGWFKRNIHPTKIVSKGQEVEVMVLDIDLKKRRVSLGIKQCLENPWSKFLADHPEKTNVSGTVRNITDFGMFLELDGELNGMIHYSDLDWVEPGDKAVAKYKRGDVVEAMVLSVDVEKERINLGIKQLTESPYQTESLKKGAIVTCVVEAIFDKGIEVSVGDTKLKTTIFRGELGQDRQDQRSDRFVVGSKVDALVTQIDPNQRKLSLSIRALERKEENEVVAQYGSSDSGAVLGDVLGAALSAALGADKDEKSAALGSDKGEMSAAPDADKDEKSADQDRNGEAKAEGKKKKTAAKTKKETKTEANEKIDDDGDSPDKNGEKDAPDKRKTAESKGKGGEKKKAAAGQDENKGDADNPAGQAKTGAEAADAKAADESQSDADAPDSDKPDSKT